MQPKRIVLRMQIGPISGMNAGFGPKITQLTNEKEFKKSIYFNKITTSDAHAVANLQHSPLKHIQIATLGCIQAHLPAFSVGRNGGGSGFAYHRLFLKQKWIAIMKLSTLLLTTTALVVAGSAYAADLPAKKGAPAAKAATGCSAFGAGYFQIPGGDNCLKISGYVRSNSTYTTDTTSRGTAPYSLAGSYRLMFDAMSNTDIGALNSHIRITDTATSYAQISVAGLTTGQFDDLGDVFSYGINGGYSGPYSGTAKGFAYSIPAGASTISLGVVSAGTTWNGTASSRPDLQIGVNTKAGPAALNVVAISHEAAGATSGSYSGYAVVGTASVAAGPATVLVQGGVASGASAYVVGYSFGTTFKDVSASSGEASTASTVGAKVSLAVGTGTLAAYGNTATASGASGSTTSLTASTMGVQYAITATKNLTVTPEVYSTTTNTGSGNTTSNNVYLRIQRDF